MLIVNVVHAGRDNAERCSARVVHTYVRTPQGLPLLSLPPISLGFVLHFLGGTLCLPQRNARTMERHDVRGDINAARGLTTQGPIDG